jgi:hypothetical protein
MEMPISIMIVLFVSVAVAILVLQFAGNIISRGAEQIQQFTLNRDDVQFFVEVANISPTLISNYVQQCYADNLGKYSGNTVCYIVHGNIQGNITQTADANLLGKVDLSNAGKTVYIKFNEGSQKVDVSG